METVPCKNVKKDALAPGRHEVLRAALFIRRFEERLLALFAEGKLNGTVHTCLGQELSALAVAGAAQPEDAVFSNHRGHGHYLAFRRNAEGLMAEIMGRATGLCGGAGGSQHLYDTNFYSNGILGGMSPVAVGLAWARQVQRQAGIAIVFHGDGAMGEGVIYESMNLAAKWGLPVLWVVERNGYAQSTSCAQTTAGEFAARARGFGLAHFAGDTWRYEDLARAAAEAARHVRETQTPALLEIATYRLAAHSKGDDNRAPAEIAEYQARDPLNRFREVDPENFSRWDAEIGVELDAIVKRCESAEPCRARVVWQPRRAGPPVSWRDLSPLAEGARYGLQIHHALAELFATMPALAMMGEDIEGPYGGAFKITRDLSERFPGRVRNTPISEAAITGAGAGAALAGLRPIVEIMFGDFLSLCLDQLLQHACKFSMMYGRHVQVPLVVRTPMGGRRGYGPTHSQSIEAHFLGVPELDVFALNVRVAPAEFYRALLTTAVRPSLVIENKILYTRPFMPACPAGFRAARSEGPYPVVRVSPAGIAPQVTVVCYGGMLEVAEEALGLAYQEDEVVAEIVCPLQLVPLDITPLCESARRTGRVVILEEGKTFAAFGSEVLAALVEAGIACKARRLGCDQFIPSSFPAEQQLLPSAEQARVAIVALSRE
jgi:2-oxoisovalerate dehydrogenase E1 component